MKKLGGNTVRARKPRIAYENVDVLAARRAAKIAQRVAAAAGSWVVGEFLVIDGVVCFAGVALQPGYWIDDTAELVVHVDRMAKWITRQAARQWLLRHPSERRRLLNLQTLKGRPPADCPRDNTAAAFRADTMREIKLTGARVRQRMAADVAYAIATSAELSPGQ